MEGKKMTNIGETYKCEICGNVVEEHEAGVGVLVCCGQNMNLVTDTTAEAAPEEESFEKA